MPKSHVLGVNKMPKSHVSSNKLSLRQLEDLVKEKYSLTKSLSKLNPHNRYQAGQPCFCPFHENHNTPAASIYDDEKGETLYCFSERKLYTVVDVFEKLMSYDVHDLGNRLWQSMSETEQQEWLIANNAYEDVFSKKEEKEDSKKLKQSIAMYKSKKLKLNDLLGQYLAESEE